MRIHLILSFALLGLAVACGGDDDDGTSDAPVTTPDANLGPDAPPPIDAAPPADAPPAECGATGDYVEAADATNDAYTDTGVPEETGLTVSATAFTIGGCINPGHAAAEYLDADFYAVTLSVDGDIRAELTSPDAASTTSLQVSVWTPEGNFAGGGVFSSGGALAVASGLPAGTYLVGVEEALPGPAAPVPYSVKILAGYPCNNMAGAPTFTEANDGTLNRGNDMFGIKWGPFTLTPTPADDSPEPTGITFADGTNVKVRGTAADVTSAGDEYDDRDAFAVTTGAAAQELRVRTTWPDGNGADLDVIVTTADAASIDDVIAAGTYISNTEDEDFTFVAAANTTYWIWVGNYTQSATAPLDYDVTVCPRATPF